ncbi:RBM17, partial [Cervus elaphus hippelaphus]
MFVYKDLGVEKSDSKIRRLVPKLQTSAVSAPNEEGSSHLGEEPRDNTKYCPCPGHPLTSSKVALQMSSRSGTPHHTQPRASWILFPVGEVLIPTAEEYATAFPNDYEKVVRGQREARQRQRELERQKREKTGMKPDLKLEIQIDEHEYYDVGQQDRPRSPTGPGNAFLTNMGRVGGGGRGRTSNNTENHAEVWLLGKVEQGLSTMLSVGQTRKREGKIIMGDTTQKDAARKVESTIKAAVDPNGRCFGGWVVKEYFYNLDKFRVLDLAGQ